MFFKLLMAILFPLKWLPLATLKTAYDKDVVFSGKE